MKYNKSYVSGHKNITVQDVKGSTVIIHVGGQEKAIQTVLNVLVLSGTKALFTEAGVAVPQGYSDSPETWQPFAECNESIEKLLAEFQKLTGHSILVEYLLLTEEDEEQSDRFMVWNKSFVLLSDGLSLGHAAGSRELAEHFDTHDAKGTVLLKNAAWNEAEKTAFKAIQKRAFKKLSRLLDKFPKQLQNLQAEASQRTQGAIHCDGLFHLHLGVTQKALLFRILAHIAAYRSRQRREQHQLVQGNIPKLGL